MTAGRAALLRVLSKTKARFVAKRCRVTTAAVYNWTSGRRIPSDAARRSLELSYGIPGDAWGEPAPAVSPEPRGG